MADTNNLEELERLLVKATPGEWRHWHRQQGQGIFGEPSADFAYIGDEPLIEDSHVARFYTQDGFGEREANAALIVALRNAAPSLIATAREVEGLRAEVARLKAEMERRSANEIKHCLNWGPCSEMDNRP